MSCESFPAAEKLMKNPAIQLFGNRLVVDQSAMEFLIELLLVSTSPKKLGKSGSLFETVFPTLEMLDGWSESVDLCYSPKYSAP